MPIRFIVIVALFFSAFLLSACAESTEAAEETAVESTTPVAEPEPMARTAEPAAAALALETAKTASSDENSVATPRPAKPATDRVATQSAAATAIQQPPSPPATPAAPAPAGAKSSTPEEPAPPAAPTPPDHSTWDQLLRQYVSAQGKVNYTGLLGQLETLENYLDELAQAVPAASWSRQAAMAYWINAYNAFTVKLILDHWPVQSIKDIRGGTPWDDKWIELAGRSYSLDQIENDILRPKYDDARIHFAVNCAAISCPPLRNRAFTADNLDRTLEQLARSFINNERYNTISAESATVSKVFDWYGQDFGTLYKYLDQYAEESLSAATEIRFQEYDWGLND